jgi:hypothetical protein
MNTQETNDKQDKSSKRVLRATDLRHMPGIAVKTDLRGGSQFGPTYGPGGRRKQPK